MEDCSCEKIEVYKDPLCPVPRRDLQSQGMEWDLPQGVVREGEREEAGEPNMV